LTISSSIRKAGPFTGNGVTVAFPFYYKVFSAADVLVVQAVTATGVETTKVLTTDYTVSLNSDQNANPGGTVTMLVAPPTGQTLTLGSKVGNLQPTDLTNFGGFYPTVINDSLDRSAIQIQQIAEKLDRAVTLPISSTESPANYLTLVTSAANTSAINASNSAISASTAYNSAVSSALSASASSNSAGESAVSANRAVAAWAASTAPSEQLAPVSASIHFGAIVKSIVYDTSKDSDGGVWRKRCADKSWYTEALGGDRWIGQQASISSAWTAAGSATGAVFQATATAGPLTSGKYYAATSSTTATEVFRGISREFPAQVAIVAEAARVVIYDLTQVACPMWMVFIGMAGQSTHIGYDVGARPLTGIAALNGQMVSCGNLSAAVIVSFVADLAIIRSIINSGRLTKNIVSRNSASLSSGDLSNVISSAVNDVAITVLDTAPIDPATGLPVPTIAVGCTGVMSVILQDGSVINHTWGSYDARKVGFTASNKLWRQAGIDNRRIFIHKTGVPSASSSVATDWIGFTDPVAAGDFPYVNSITFSQNPIAVGNDVYGGGSTGVFAFKANPITPAKSMQAQITNAYNSGWLPGDIRGAYLADTVAETITASGELVTNGDFAGGSTGWTFGASGAGTAPSVAGGVLSFNSVTTDYVWARQVLSSLVAGRTYTVTLDCAYTSGNFQVLRDATILGGVVSSGFKTFTLIATATSHILEISRSAGGNNIATFDNISVKLAEPDRSVKNTGMVINGSLTKTAVATGAGLVAYSGFSASNYLEQPYSANLDFGTGDFSVMGWVNITSAANNDRLFMRKDPASGTAWFGATTIAGVLNWQNGTTTSTGYTLTAGQWTHICFERVSGVTKCYVNGAATSLALSDATNYTNVLATLDLGVDQARGSWLTGSMSLWRITATAPSADQIAHIYRTELPLFQAGAQCTIAGTSTAVTALAYDDVADTLHVGTSWGRSGFRDLLRVDSEATTTGAITSLSANEGVVITGGASSAKAYAPAMYLRDELRRKDIARKALGRIPAFFDYTATASQTAFVAPKGFTIKALYKNGTLMRETTTGVYWTRSNDGFQETATLSVGASVSDWISLMCVRT
jgi:hypothetical protein